MKTSGMAGLAFASLLLGGAPVAAQAPDAELRAKCLATSGDLSEPAGIIMFKHCMNVGLQPSPPAVNLRAACLAQAGDLSEPANIILFKNCMNAGSSPNGPPQPLADSNGCLPGLVHRRAQPEDVICVPPARAAEITLESLAAIGRIQAGSDYCQRGFVWRDAAPKDHACVSPDSRKQIADESAHALSGFAYLAGTKQNLCDYVDPAKAGRDLGLAEAPNAHSTNAGDCTVEFPAARALVEINLTPREQFGFGSMSSRAVEVRGLGEKALFDTSSGTDGVPTQKLGVLLGDTALTIQVDRALAPGPQWSIGEAVSILLAIEAREAKQP
jgi:hypothetical protein